MIEEEESCEYFEQMEATGRQQLPQTVQQLLRFSRNVTEVVTPVPTSTFKKNSRPQSVAGPKCPPPKQFLPVRPHTSSQQFRPLSDKHHNHMPPKPRPCTPNTMGFFTGRPHTPLGRPRTSVSDRPRPNTSMSGRLESESEYDRPGTGMSGLFGTDTGFDEEKENPVVASSSRILVTSDINLRPTTLPTGKLALLTPQVQVSGVRKTNLRMEFERYALGHKVLAHSDFFVLSTFYDSGCLKKHSIDLTDRADVGNFTMTRTRRSKNDGKPTWKVFDGQFIDVGKIVVGSVHCFQVELRNNSFVKSKFILYPENAPFATLEYSPLPCAPGLSRTIGVTVNPTSEHIGEWIGWVRVRSTISGTEMTEFPIYCCILPEDSPSGAMPPERCRPWVPSKFP